jgi:hypothetical protein
VRLPRIQPLQVRYDVTEQRYFPHFNDWHDASTHAGDLVAQARDYIRRDVSIRSAARGRGGCDTVHDERTACKGHRWRAIHECFGGVVPSSWAIHRLSMSHGDSPSH